MVSRRRGELMPLEVALLSAGIELQSQGVEPYGFLLAKRLADGRPGALTAHGTLYKALNRLVAAGLLESSWEDPAISEGESRPRRRLYQVTGEGELALSRGRAEERERAADATRTAARVTPRDA